MTTLPENMVTLVCQQYAVERQFGSLATLMRLNRRTYSYGRALMYKQLDFIDDRTSRYFAAANQVHEEYEGGDKLDEDILSAIDCRDIDPLDDLAASQRWLRSLRQVEVVEIKDMLYGRDINNLYEIALSLAKRDILLLPKLQEIIISQRVVKRVHAAGPKHTPMDLLVILFLASRPTRLHFADADIFRPPPARWFVPLANTSLVNGRTPPHRHAHISHAVIEFMIDMPSLREVQYDQVDPNVPIRPCPGVKHIVTFRPSIPASPPAYTSSSSSIPSSRNGGVHVNEVADIVATKTAVYDIIIRSVVPISRIETARLHSTNPDTDRATRQSSWHIHMPFTRVSSPLVWTFKEDLHARLEVKYEPDTELLEQIFASLSLSYDDP